MYQIYCTEKKIFMQGNMLEPLMRQAGFVDLQHRVVNIEIGEWAQGNLAYFLMDYYYEVLTRQMRDGTTWLE